MAYRNEKGESHESYGRQVPAQPGGPSPQPPVSPKSCSAPARLGPARPGGNAARRLIPNNEKR